MITLYVSSQHDLTAEDTNQIGKLLKRDRSTLLGPERGKRVCYLFQDDETELAHELSRGIFQLGKGYVTVIKKGLPRS